MAVTTFTMIYAWRGGLRSSLLTDAGQMLLAAAQVLSYPFHDPVLTDRGFLTKPDVMVKGFLLAGLLSGVFSTVGLYARAERLRVLQR